jgi:multidrug resistance protein, MATE family
MLLTNQNAFTREAWLGELRATLMLGSPLVLTNVAQIALTTTDVIVLGRLGAEALAAGTLGVNLYFALLIFAIGLVGASAPMMAVAVGRNQHVMRNLRRTFRQGLWSAVMVSLPCWVLLWHAETVLLWFNEEPRLAAAAQSLVRALQWGFFPALGFVVLRSFVASLERPIWALIATGATVLLNIAANWALVFGHLGLPALGLRGSGLATTLSNTFLFISLALVVVVDREFRRYRLFGNWWRPDWPRLVALWRLGVPIGATLAFEVTVFNAAVFLMGQFGTTALAAHSIAIQIAASSFMVPLGLGQAATVRVGIAHGARDLDGITRAGWTAFGLAVSFMATMSMVMMTAPRLLIGVFVDVDDPANAAVVQTAASFLICAAVFQVADGAQGVGAGMLRGLQDTRVPMLYAAFGYWGVGMSLSLLFGFKVGLGGLGIWIGLVVALVVVACAMMQRWIRRERLGLLRAP